jgi:hypothetical protein
MVDESLPPSSERRAHWTPLPQPAPRSRFSLKAPEGRANAAAAGFTLAASGAAYMIEEPLARSLVLLGCAALTYVVGLFQPRPRL